MKTIPATEAKNRFGEVLDQALQEPVEISKQGRPVAVMLSSKTYAQITKTTQKCQKKEERKKLIEFVENLPTNGKASSLEDYYKALDEKYS